MTTKAHTMSRVEMNLTLLTLFSPQWMLTSKRPLDVHGCKHFFIFFIFLSVNDLSVKLQLSAHYHSASTNLLFTNSSPGFFHYKKLADL